MTTRATRPHTGSPSEGTDAQPRPEAARHGAVDPPVDVPDGGPAGQAGGARRRPARERELIHALRRAEHPDDVGADLRWFDRAEVGHVVARRREFDKVAPLIRWAEAVVDGDAVLRAAGQSERRAHFRSVVGHGLMADHALFHLEWSVLRLETDLVPRYVHPWDRRQAPIVELVRDLYAAGRHDDLNRMLKERRQADARPRTRRERQEAERAGLSPWTSPTVRGRLLAGAHDIDAFAAEARSDRVVREVVTELHRSIG